LDSIALTQGADPVASTIQRLEGLALTLLSDAAPGSLQGLAKGNHGDEQIPEQRQREVAALIVVTFDAKY